MKSIDLSGQKVVTLRDAQGAAAGGATQVLTAENCVITPSARDFLQQHGIDLSVDGKGKAAAIKSTGEAAVEIQPAGSSSHGRRPANPKLFSTPEAEAIKKEICAVGKRRAWLSCSDRWPSLEAPSAKAAKTNTSGSITCTAVAGELKFSPPLASNGTTTGSETTTFKGTLGSCTGGDGATVVASSGKVAELTTTNDGNSCAGFSAATLKNATTFIPTSTIAC